MTFKTMISPYINWENYLKKPTFVATILFLLAVFHVPIIFLLIYVTLVYIDNVEADDEINLTLQFKRKDDSVGKVDIKVPASNEQIVKQYAFELLFRERDSRIVKGTDVKNAIENARLTPEELADFAGAEPL